MELDTMSKPLVRLATMLSLAFSIIQPSQAKTQLELVSFEDPPYVFSDHAMTNGLVERFVERLMSHSDISYSLRLLPPKRAVLYTLNTPNTCIFPIEKSQEREAQFSWVSPILVSRHGLFQIKGGKPIHGQVLDDFSDYRIGSYLGSGIGEYLQSLSFKVDYAASNDANIHKLGANRIDLWASDVVTARFIAKRENVRVSKPRLEFFTTLRAIGCHKSVPSTTIKRMQTELEAMYQSGEISTLKTKFFQ